MECPNCHERIPLSARACFNCGTERDNFRGSQTGEAPRKRSMFSAPVYHRAFPHSARTKEATALRDRPFPSSRPITTVAADELLTALAAQYDFLQVEIADGRRGFMAMLSVEAVESAGAPIVAAVPSREQQAPGMPTHHAAVEPHRQSLPRTEGALAVDTKDESLVIPFPRPSNAPVPVNLPRGELAGVGIDELPLNPPAPFQGENIIDLTDRLRETENEGAEEGGAAAGVGADVWSDDPLLHRATVAETHFSQPAPPVWKLREPAAGGPAGDDGPAGQGKSGPLVSKPTLDVAALRQAAYGGGRRIPVWVWGACAAAAVAVVVTGVVVARRGSSSPTPAPSQPVSVQPSVQPSQIVTLRPPIPTVGSSSPVPSAIPGQPPRSSEQAPLAFQTNVYNQWRVAVTDGNGQNPRAFTTGDWDDGEPSWSHDGSRLVFVSNRGGSFHVFTVGADGGGVSQITKGPQNDRRPMFSPDGYQIAFTSDRDGGKDQVFVMLANGTAVRQLTQGDRSSHPSWSPDGSKLAFTREVSGVSQIFVIDVKDGNLTKLTAANQNHVDPAWSPDGKEIAYSSFQDGMWSIFVMRADGSAPRRLTTADTARQPAWSPDGASIAFAQGPEGQQQVVVVGRNGGETRRFINGVGHAIMPSWPRQ